MKPIKQITPYEERFKQEILNFINNPDDKLVEEIKDKILACCGKKVNLDYKYDGYSRCEISGKYLTEDDKITINGHDFSNAELQRQMQFGGIIDFSIDIVDIFNYEGTKIIELELNDENLVKMYSENLKGLREMSKQYYNQKQRDRDGNFQFTCPLTKKQYYTALEGIFYDKELYSLEGLTNYVGKDESQIMKTSVMREKNYIEKFLFRKQQQQMQQEN